MLWLSLLHSAGVFSAPATCDSIWALNWGSWGASAYSQLLCPLQGSNLQKQHKGISESDNPLNIPIMACQRSGVRVLDLNTLSIRWWKICDAFYSYLKIMSAPSLVCIPTFSHRHIVLHHLFPSHCNWFTRNKLLLIIVTNPADQHNAVSGLFSFYWGVVNQVNLLPAAWQLTAISQRQSPSLEMLNRYTS